MRVFVLGGTGFTGPHVVRRLVAAGCEVTVFHRGKTRASLPSGVTVRHGDASDLGAALAAAPRPDVFLDMIPFRRDDARARAAIVRERVGRVVALSSADVYLSYGRLFGTESGAPLRGPQREDAPLRAKLSAQGERYDKVGVEAEYAALDATIVRLPVIFGPDDAQHRFFSWQRAMRDRRPAIAMTPEHAACRISRVFVEDAAAGIAQVVLHERCIGQTYNIAEPEAPTERDWVELIARLEGWKGQVVLVETARWPESLRGPANYEHHLVLDTARIRSDVGYAETVTREHALHTTLAWQRECAPDPAPPTDYAALDALLA